MPYINDKLLWQHCFKNSASFSTALGVVQDSQYFTTAKEDLNFFKKMVPGLFLQHLAVPVNPDLFVRFLEI